MKVSKLIEDLKHIEATEGDIEVQLQSDPTQPAGAIMNTPNFFVVVEPYEGEGQVVNIRSWPY